MNCQEKKENEVFWNKVKCQEKQRSVQDRMFVCFSFISSPTQFHCFLNMKRYTNAFEADKIGKVKQSSAQQEQEYL